MKLVRGKNNMFCGLKNIFGHELNFLFIWDLICNKKIEMDKPQIFNKKFLHSQKTLFLIMKNRPLQLNTTSCGGVRMLWLLVYSIDFVKFLWPENTVNLVGRVKYGYGAEKNYILEWGNKIRIA